LVVKGHQVPVVDIRVHLGHGHDGVAFRTGWGGNAEVKVVAAG
jgi:hypothetical protein